MCGESWLRSLTHHPSSQGWAPGIPLILWLHVCIPTTGMWVYIGSGFSSFYYNSYVVCYTHVFSCTQTENENTNISVILLWLWCCELAQTEDPLILQSSSLLFPDHNFSSDALFGSNTSHLSSVLDRSRCRSLALRYVCTSRQNADDWWGIGLDDILLTNRRRMQHEWSFSSCWFGHDDGEMTQVSITSRSRAQKCCCQREVGL